MGNCQTSCKVAPAPMTSTSSFSLDISSVSTPRRLAYDPDPSDDNDDEPHTPSTPEMRSFEDSFPSLPLHGRRVLPLIIDTTEHLLHDEFSIDLFPHSHPCIPKPNTQCPTANAHISPPACVTTMSPLNIRRTLVRRSSFTG